METKFKATGKFRKEADYPIRDLDEICENCGYILGKHRALSERCPKQKNISSKPMLCDENCDPFFIKTDEHGYCKKCFKNLGYVRK